MRDAHRRAFLFFVQRMCFIVLTTKKYDTFQLLKSFFHDFSACEIQVTFHDLETTIMKGADFKHLRLALQIVESSSCFRS